MIGLFSPLRTPTDKLRPVALSSSLQSLAIATLVSTIFYCPNAVGKTLKERVTNTSFYLAGWACFTLSLRFIPLTQLVAKYLSPEVDTTVAYTEPVPAGFLYRAPLLTCKNHSKILAHAEQYLKENPTAKKNTEAKLITTEKILIGSLALCTSAIFLKKSLQKLTSEVKAIHYVASLFFTSTLFHPFILPTIQSAIQLALPEVSHHVADLRDFYKGVDTFSSEEQKVRVEAISYGIQQVRAKVMEEDQDESSEDWVYTPPNSTGTKTYIPIALGIIGIMHVNNYFTMPKLQLSHQVPSRVQKTFSFLFDFLAYPYFTTSVHQVVSSVFNT